MSVNRMQAVLRAKFKEWELCSEDHTRLGKEGTLLRRREKVLFSEDPGKSYKHVA